MKKYLYGLSFLVLLCGAFWVGTRYHQPEAGMNDPVPQARRVLYYVDPMNPAHTSNEPGIAPCGMQMEPVYADSETAGAGSPSDFLPPGMVRITPEKQQMIGVRVEPVKTASHWHALRTLGRVAADENRTYRVTAGDFGYVWHVGDATTGSLVENDQLVARVYYDQFLTRLEDYIRALEFEDRQQGYAKNNQAPALVAAQGASGSRLGEHRGLGMDVQASEGSAAQSSSFANGPGMKYGGLNAAGRVLYNIRDQLVLSKLELYELGVGETQIEDIGRNRALVSDVEIRSPVKGIVLSRNASAQQRFIKGDELFRIADLGRVWILADVFEQEAMYIRPGMKAKVTLPHQGQVFEATVTEVPPVYDAVTRVLKVRLETDNLEYVLRPDMFVDVEFLINLPEAVVVAADAVLDSGLSRTVFVDHGNGRFEPRAVKTGWRLGDRVEIVAGLMAGERIAVSGNFFINSESRMKPAAAGFHSTHAVPGKDAASGPEVSPGKDKDPGLYAGKPAGAMPAVIPVVHKALPAPGFQKDPVCGMHVHEQEAGASGFKSEYQGKPYYFCSDFCKKQFDHAAERFVKIPAGDKGQPDES